MFLARIETRYVVFGVNPGKKAGVNKIIENCVKSPAQIFKYPCSFQNIKCSSFFFHSNPLHNMSFPPCLFLSVVFNCAYAPVKYPELLQTTESYSGRPGRLLNLRLFEQLVCSTEKAAQLQPLGTAFTQGASIYYVINFGPILDPPPLNHQDHHSS